MLSELCVLCERKTFTKYVSSPIGVTSHITPLAIRRGAGGEAKSNRGNLTYHSPPYGGGEGGGANWGWGWGHCEFCERQRVFIIETI